MSNLDSEINKVEAQNTGAASWDGSTLEALRAIALADPAGAISYLARFRAKRDGLANAIEGRLILSPTEELATHLIAVIDELLAAETDPHRMTVEITEVHSP